ncbi:hypothetical protein [Synechococcus elongatus]|uniref:Uncharacterized protein n=1 Tax=Synechococcus elongatus PCC 11802 TaxID=2283154 RepID=A0AAT9K045_SYNEL|nr:hypothetical protein [Synechococcus elongatus]QFZ93116.1 hypothetical protein EKO22_13070 [Synechococcus elongatus PCC 11802]
MSATDRRWVPSLTVLALAIQRRSLVGFTRRRTLRLDDQDEDLLYRSLPETLTLTTGTTLS